MSVIDIYLQNQDQMQSIITILGGFYTTKCFQLCIGKYIQGSGLEDSLKQTRVFEVKVVDSVLNRTNYVRSLKVILILSNAIEMLKWNLVLEINNRRASSGGGGGGPQGPDPCPFLLQPKLHPQIFRPI